MRPMTRGIATLATAIALAACSGGGATGAPTSAATSNPTAAGTEAPGGTAAGTATCQDSTGATIVEAPVGDFTWAPVSAKVGDVITWTNSDSAPHAVALDDGSCTMDGNIAGGGGTKSLVFDVAGTFPFHCSVHPNMKGTITIS